MIKAILACGLFFINTAYALEQKVYSASELQKIADGVFRELNLDNKTSFEKLELLVAPAEVKKEETLKQIAKAMQRRNDVEISDIYQQVRQASVSEDSINDVSSSVEPVIESDKTIVGTKSVDKNPVESNVETAPLVDSKVEIPTPNLISAPTPSPILAQQQTPQPLQPRQDVVKPKSVMEPRLETTTRPSGRLDSWLQQNEDKTKDNSVSIE